MYNFRTSSTSFYCIILILLTALTSIVLSVKYSTIFNSPFALTNTFRIYFERITNTFCAYSLVWTFQTILQTNRAFLTCTRCTPIFSLKIITCIAWKRTYIVTHNTIRIIWAVKTHSIKETNNFSLYFFTLITIICWITTLA